MQITGIDEVVITLSPEHLLGGAVERVLPVGLLYIRGLYILHPVALHSAVRQDGLIGQAH
ncbi:hypothetical protein SDC9_179305 [bioreactor metagenome]|uniref:Uncharacterized protein n=1 Tax=bioreactor metagenome TaxID=1076179 RepID=A0A645GZJ0_9ZZZZ